MAVNGRRRSRSARARSSPSPACRATARPSSSRRSPGLRQADSGEISVGGDNVTTPEPAQDLGPRGRAHPRGPPARRADRRTSRSPRTSSSTATTVRRSASGGSLNLRRDRQRGRRRRVKDFDVRTPSITTHAGHLSGGNQQKVVVAREFSRPVKLRHRVAADARPRRRLDRVHPQADRRAARRRRRVLIVSTELDEVLAVGDRIAVMFGGRIVGVLDGADATYEKVGMLMGGAE